MPPLSRVTVDEIRRAKQKARKLVMLTAYDYSFAKLVDESGVDIVLVGDSLAMVVLGEQDTTTVTQQDMLRHAKAARKGVTRALLVGDLPYPAIHSAGADLTAAARAFIEEAGCDAVKVEWADGMPNRVRKVLASGIAVMGHVGLTPQTALAEGGFGMRGKDAASAARILSQAQALEQAGCFAIVLECVPDQVAQAITERLAIPTIGIGSGPNCDGQVLVLHDVLGLFERFTPKFVKRYAKLSEEVRNAVRAYAGEVRSGQFPGASQTVKMSREEESHLRRLLKSESKNKT